MADRRASRHSIGDCGDVTTGAFDGDVTTGAFDGDVTTSDANDADGV
jgi:hypothetical protein